MPPRILVLRPSGDAADGPLTATLRALGAALSDPASATAAAHAGADGLVLSFGAEAPTADALLDAFLKDGKPILAIGAGALLLAEQLGAVTAPSSAPEFGFVDVAPTAAGRADPVTRGIGKGCPLLQWHDRALGLPLGAELLLLGERDRAQAFRVGAHIHAFRAELDLDAATIRERGIARSREKNNPAIAVRLSGETARHLDRAAAFATAVASAWLARLGPGG